MDEHRLRLRYENGLSTSLGENAVRRVNKRIRQLAFCTSSQEKLESVHALLRDLSTVRDMILVQQLRHNKFQKLNLTETTEALNQQQTRLEAELKEKSELHENLNSEIPKTGPKTDPGRTTLRPISLCDAEIRVIEKLELELDDKIHRQEQDLRKWKELGSNIQELLKSKGEETGLAFLDSTVEELEPKIKKWCQLSIPHESLFFLCSLGSGKTHDRSIGCCPLRSPADSVLDLRRHREP